MISNPEIQAALSPATPSTPTRWPRLFSHWQLLALVPGMVHRLAAAGRVLELEVGGSALLTGLARLYPSSQFIGLTSLERAKSGSGPVEMTARNLHFRTVEAFDLSRFRQVDLIVALGGLQERTLVAEAARAMAPGGQLVVRERDRGRLQLMQDPGLGTRYINAADADWSAGDPVRHGCTVRTLAHAFTALHALRLPEDPGFVYYVAQAA